MPTGPVPPPMLAATGMASSTVMASRIRVADMMPRRPFSGSCGLARGGGFGRLARPRRSPVALGHAGASPTSERPSPADTTEPVMITPVPAMS